MIGIHQSQFLPWIPYFFKIAKSDVFVILDDVQYQKNGVQNRNMIKTPQGGQWITIPVSLDLGDPINRVRIADPSIFGKLIKTIDLNYKKAPYYDTVSGMLNKAFAGQPLNLHELNTRLLAGCLELLDIRTPLVMSSSMCLREKKDDLVLEIITARKETHYLSGKGALGYMHMDKFDAAGVKVSTFDFNHPPYPQLWMKQKGFVPELSVVDLLMNGLPNARKYIMDNGTIV